MEARGMGRSARMGKEQVNDMCPPNCYQETHYDSTSIFFFKILKIKQETPVHTNNLISRYA